MRKTITQLLADVGGDFPDNTTGQITPAILRSFLGNALDSIPVMTSLIGGSPGAPVVQALSTTPAKMAAGVFSVVVNGNAAVMEARLPQDDVLIKTNVGRVLMIFNVTWAAGNGIDIAFTLAKNGVPLVFRAVGSGLGAGNPLSTEFSWVFETLNNGDFFELFINSLAGTPNIDLHNAGIKSFLLPQFS